MSRQTILAWRLSGCPCERRSGRYYFDADEVKQWRFANVSRDNPVLLKAKRRKMIAQLRLAADDVEKLERSVLLPEAIHLASAAIAITCVTGFMKLIDAAPLVVKQSVPVANSILADKVYNILLDISNTRQLVPSSPEEGNPDDDVSDERKREPEDFAKMDDSALSARRISLQAKRLEILHRLKRGQLKDADEVHRDIATHSVNVKQKALSLPMRLAPQIIDVSVAQARKAIYGGVVEVLEELVNPPWLTRQQLDSAIAEQTPIDMSPAHVSRPTRIRTRRAVDKNKVLINPSTPVRKRTASDNVRYEVNRSTPAKKRGATGKGARA